MIAPGDALLVGGFMVCGCPTVIVDAILERGTKELTVISNDTGTPGEGLSKLVHSRQISRLIASHIGLNPETGQQMNEGVMRVDLIPQGTLAERIRCAGAGLGGVLTPTGVGTIVAEGKQVITLDGRDYLLELPLRARFALVKAHKADTYGNLVYRGSARNFNPVMATAADIVIAEVEHLVQPGDLDPNTVVTPGVFVDYLVPHK